MYIGYFCGAEGAAKIFLPPIDGGHCPPSNFRRGALPPINFEILGIAPHQKFELSVPGGGAGTSVEILSKISKFEEILFCQK